MNLLPRSLRALMLLGLAALAPAHAATITVTTTDFTSTTQCNLIDAIAAANSDAAVNGCAAGNGADTIVLPTAATFTLTTPAVPGIGLPQITSAITILGNGSTLARSTQAGTPRFQLFNLKDGSALTLDQLTLTGGSTTTTGGAIAANNAALTLRRCTFSNNVADSDGGAVQLSNSGSMTVSDSLFRNNQSGNAGGAIQVAFATTSSITRSSFTGNTAARFGGGLSAATNATITISFSRFSGNTVGTNGNGGAIDSTGSLTLTQSSLTGNTGGANGGGFSGNGALSNCTISGNTASVGGGVQGSGTVSLDHCTVTGNVSTNTFVNGNRGGGIFGSFGTTTLRNTVVAGNTSADGSGSEIHNLTLRGKSTVVVNGNNLLGHKGLSDAQAFTNITPGATDLKATSNGLNVALSDILELDTTVTPAVPALKDNGGLTPTVALVLGSPAIDAADATVCANAAINNKDQRDATRPVGAGCDIGAFEYDGTSTRIINNANTQNQDVTFASSKIFSTLTATDPKVDGYTAPAGTAFSNFGLYNFKLKGVANAGVVTVTITLPVGTNVIGYVKCDAGTKACVNFPAPAGPNQQGAVINANVITLTLVDGVTPGDSDGANNGTITDPGAPVIAAAGGGATAASGGGGAMGLPLLLVLGGIALLGVALRRNKKLG